MTKQLTERQEQIMDLLGEKTWDQVQQVFEKCDLAAIKACLDATFPTEDNLALAIAIDETLEDYEPIVGVFDLDRNPEWAPENEDWVKTQENRASEQEIHDAIAKEVQNG